MSFTPGTCRVLPGEIRERSIPEERPSTKLLRKLHDGKKWDRYNKPPTPESVALARRITGEDKEPPELAPHREDPETGQFVLIDQLVDQRKPK